MLKVGKQVAIARVDPVVRYKLKLVFSDGLEKIIDFEPFLSGSLNPETRRFLDGDAFASYRIEWGNLVWGDYEMCFPIEDLYAGRLAPEKHLMVAENHATYGAPDTVAPSA